MTTATLTLALTLTLWTVRHRLHTLPAVWNAAQPWERAVIVLSLAPIPGPFDELAGLLVARRILKRKTTNERETP